MLRLVTFLTLLLILTLLAFTLERRPPEPSPVELHFRFEPLDLDEPANQATVAWKGWI